MTWPELRRKAPVSLVQADIAPAPISSHPWSRGAVETIPSKTMTTLLKGDRVIVTTAGGGGNGPRADRDARAVERDIQDGKVSV